jgi:ubiquinone/menaquinone biosynthesis C-methylase UbiE
MTTKAQKKDPIYTMGHSEAETRRLISTSKLYGNFTRRLLEDAGIDEGMSVLDVGTGDVALMAAEMVGPKGSVVGVDQDPQMGR